MRNIGYSEEFKKSAVQKVLLRGSKSVATICEELGISTPSLYEWKRQYAIEGGMKKSPRRPKDWTASEKFRAVIEYFKLTEQEQGEFLRKEGLHSENIEGWKKQMEISLDGDRVSRETRAEASQLKAEINELRKDLQRKDRALAETTALLILKKKADILWGKGEEE